MHFQRKWVWLGLATLILAPVLFHTAPEEEAKLLREQRDMETIMWVLSTKWKSHLPF